MPDRNETRAAYKAFESITTRWMDNDVYGHVNNVQYYSYFDTAVSLWLIEHGVLDIHQDSVIGLVVETSCSYFKPIAFPAMVHVGLRVSKLGTSSVRFELGIFCNDDEIVTASGYFVYVYVDRTDNRPVPLPDTLRAVLSTIVA